MTLTAGMKLGPYEIVSPLGSGGMGEVYRARDTRLGREVAVKILPERLSADADALARFEREARAVAALSHPNILGIFDFGAEGGTVYAAMELLQGETLRERLSAGALTQRKAIEYGLQTVDGLAAAHEKGIVHRDLKPENIFVTGDGRIKLLDFGLAKLLPAESAASAAPTAELGTEPGVVMGTVGYMSPEQVRGKPADHRSDIFSFGAVLYEMLSGRRAFRGDSAAETMAAIAREDPPELSATGIPVSPPLEGIVRHCLEKNPGERFQSARDLAFALQSVTGLSSKSGLPAAAAPRRAGSRRWAAAGALALAAAALFAGWRLGERRARVAPPVFRRLTFRRGNVLFARFTPDGQNIVYSAAWDDRPAELFITRIGRPESRPLGIANADLLAISRNGELAIKLKKRNLYGTVGPGTLARVALEGGAPRQILEEVDQADWSPDGRELAITRASGGKEVLEFPVGKPLYSSVTGIINPRVSPKGDRIAFNEIVDFKSAVSVVDLAGRKRTLTKGWASADELTWAPSGREIWFDSIDDSGVRSVSAVTLDGRVRVVTRAIDLFLHDLAPDGRALVELEVSRQALYFGRAGQPGERDLSWFDGSSLSNLSNDGTTVAFTEAREAGSPGGGAYLRGTDGSAAVKLGDGIATDLSGDGTWVTVASASGRGIKLSRVPARAGESVPVNAAGLTIYGGGFTADGRRLLLGGLGPGGGVRLYVSELDGSKASPVTPEGVNVPIASSPDGQSVALVGPDGRPTIYSLDGKNARAIPGAEKGEGPIQWSADGKAIYLRRAGDFPARVYRCDLATGARTLWREIAPADRAGVITIDSIHMTPDSSAYAYDCERILTSDLYLVEGWK